MSFALAPNPLAPLMWVALVLAGIMLVATVIWINLFNRHYPTRESRRAVRYSEPDGRKVLAGFAFVLLTLALALTASVGDVATYAGNVQRVRDVARAAGLTLSEDQAQALLGNDSASAYKPIVPDSSGAVGATTISGVKAEVTHLSGQTYRLVIEKNSKENS